jgi:hypothetical protein
MGHRDTLLCDTTYRNATAARSAPRASVRRSQSGFVQSRLIGKFALASDTHRVSERQEQLA